jgi:hypothetical protein
MRGYLGRVWRSAVKGVAPLRPLASSIYANDGPTRQTTHNETSFEQSNIERVAPVSRAPESTDTARRPSTGREEARAHEFANLKYEPLLPPQSRPSFETSAAAPEQKVSKGFDATRIWNREADARVNDPMPRNLGDLRSQMAPIQWPAKRHLTADAVDMQTGDAQVERDLDHPAHIPESHKSPTHAVNESTRQREPLAPISQQQLPQPAQQKSAVPAHRNEISIKPVPEPDVQVHIGRIEVVAVQPPASRAPVPRQSRTTSLHDYLSSRSGRNQ